MSIRDAIVVGAGPAGVAAARKLARGGCRVLLLDRSDFPREKTCGGLLSGKALAAIGQPLPSEVTLGRVNGLRMVSSRGLIAQSGHLPGRAALVDRAAFDAWMTGLAQEDGVDFRPGIPVHKVVSGVSAATVYTDSGAMVARWVIGADGAASTVARTTGQRRHWAPWQIGSALTREWRESDLPEDLSGFIELHSIGLVGALGWLFTWPGGWRIGVAAAACFRPRLREALDLLQDRLSHRFLRELRPTNTCGGVVPAAVFHPCLGRGRVLLAGDAAGLADPFSGEGIDAAILSGEAAARQILVDDGQSLKHYRKWWYGQYIHERRLSLLLALACWKKGPRFFDAVAFSSGWADSMAAWMDGCIGYGPLWRKTLRGRAHRTSPSPGDLSIQDHE